MSYNFVTEDGPASFEMLCREYFLAGYTHDEMCLRLSEKHNVQTSPRHLRRLLSGMGLKRRNSWDLTSATAAIQSELRGSGQSLGYRALQRRLLSRYGLTVPRALVADIQRVVDPEGVEARKNHRLRRRMYFNEGPNFLVHIDGYDKLKRFGFAIHGAVDGFSRRILWLEVGRTNNKPEIVASYFTKYLAEIQGAPRCIRIDAGTENVLIEDIQRSFRFDHIDDLAHKCVIMGSSPHNQRIERYWRNYREGGGQFWIHLFRNLETDGHFEASNPLHIDYMRFSFMEVIRTDLAFQMMEWNQHTIRRSSNTESCAGKPDIMFFNPRLYDTVDFKTNIAEEDIEHVRRVFCEVPHPRGCDPVIDTACQQLMISSGRRKPTTYMEAKELYLWLLTQNV